LSNISIISSETELGILTKTVQRVLGYKLCVGSDSSSKGNTRSLESRTITSDEEILIGNGSIKWEFSLAVGSSTGFIDGGDNDPNLDITSSITSLVIGGSYLLSEGWESGLVTDEG
jgi:hypothetical protein